MKYSTSILTGLAATAVALPTTDLAKRQFGSSTSDELQGECRAITFIFARGSTESGNMASPATCSALKDQYGDDGVACQGVGGAYDASLGSNALPEGTTSAAIEEARGLFAQAASQCSDTVITAGGYSQGAAVMTGAISGLDESVKARVHGVVLYGNTRNAQEGGKIPDFPEEEVLTICATSDGVCTGSLTVTAAHLGYQADVPEAVDFIASRVEAAGGADSGGSPTGSTPSSVPSSTTTTTPTEDSGTDSEFGSWFDFFSRYSSN